MGVAALLRPIEPAAGLPRYNWDLLRVERMLLWLEQVAAEMYGLVLTITTERDIPNQLRHDSPKSFIRRLLNLKGKREEQGS